MNAAPLRDGHESCDSQIDAYRAEIAHLTRQCERLRVALQDVQGVALNGTPETETEADRLYVIDRRITRELKPCG